MDDDYESIQTFNFKLTREDFALSSSPDQYDINFNFNFKFRISEIVLNQHSTTPQFIRHDDLSISRRSCVTFKLEYLSNRTDFFYEIREAVDRLLACLPLPVSDNGRERLVEFAWRKACQAVRENFLCDYEVIGLDFLVQVQDQHVFGLPRTSNECDVGSGEDAGRCCCICLEDLSGGGGGCGAALGLPCSHVFHGGCIRRWLRTSRYCPLCRFRLSASEMFGFQD